MRTHFVNPVLRNTYVIKLLKLVRLRRSLRSLQRATPRKKGLNGLQIIVCCRAMGSVIVMNPK